MDPQNARLGRTIPAQPVCQAENRGRVRRKLVKINDFLGEPRPLRNWEYSEAHSCSPDGQHLFGKIPGGAAVAETMVAEAMVVEASIGLTGPRDAWIPRS